MLMITQDDPSCAMLECHNVYVKGIGIKPKVPVT